jgi:23S rRNA pseudouridine1911/1915/1917 synthase
MKMGRRQKNSKKTEPQDDSNEVLGSTQRRSVSRRLARDHWSQPSTEEPAATDLAEEELDDDLPFPLPLDLSPSAASTGGSAGDVASSAAANAAISRVHDRPELIRDAAGQQHFEFGITHAEEGKRLDIFLAEQFPELSRVKLRRTISAGHAAIDGEIIKPAFRLEPGQRLSLAIPPNLFEDDQKGEPMELDILWEDEHLIAINKPAGMVVHPAKGHWRGTLTSGLIYRFQQLSSLGGATRPGIVHRLDRETSGVILVAKTDQAHMGLVDQFQNRTVAKEYWAIVSPAPNFDQDRIDLPIGKHPYQRERMAIRENHATSRQAETVFQVTERFQGFAVLRVAPKTGRTHQIRVHLAHIGCPVLCDRLYSGRASLTEAMLHGGVDQAAGNDTTALLNRQALHAHTITFRHPLTGQELKIEAPLPADLLQTWEALRRIRSLEKSR